MKSLQELCQGLPLEPLPPHCPLDESVPHAPVKTHGLSVNEKKLALQNSLRYFPAKFHDLLAPEFAEELNDFGHIYMYRFRPNIEMRAYPIQEYTCRCQQAAAIMLMIMNNLDPSVAQFPHELVTYGGNGQVFSNWAQFLLVMKYLSEMTEEQTLVLYSGHPLGLFPSHRLSPRLVISNGMVVPHYSSRDTYEKLFALGASMYGQMTAGSFCYIGPQGIVHGTSITILNSARKYLKTDNLSGKVFVSSGLGGMSGAQAKAAVICGCIGVIAEVSKAAIDKRYDQGWLCEVTDDLDCLVKKIGHARAQGLSTSIGFHGNVVHVWERLVKEFDRTSSMLVDLGSDQTSCHNPYHGGYCPVQLSFEESQSMMRDDPACFRDLVQESLRRQVTAINHLADHGMFFWDYGNAFLLEASKAGADLNKVESMDGTRFRYPSYIQDIMGDIFSMGFGPFRWVCTSGQVADLEKTDNIAATVMEKLMVGASSDVKQQLKDNIRWIKEASGHNMVVGSQARILYSDQQGRVAVALEFNKAVAGGLLKGPIVISRDHHDVSGTDSPFRETSNVYDGTAICADMAVQNVIGGSFRGATWVAIHNGGGVGWGMAVNGGFGHVLDGSDEAAEQAKMILSWDVSNGVARRCWSGNNVARETISRTMESDTLLKVTLPHKVENCDIFQHVL